MKKTFSRLLLCCLSLILLTSYRADARTIVLEGRLDSKISVTQQVGFRVDRPLSKLNFRFALPATFSNRSINQDLDRLNIEIDPRPEAVDDEVDRFGNRFKTIRWRNLDRDPRIRITFEARVKADLEDMESRAPFPLDSIPQKDSLYLQSTEMVQSTSPEIRSLARELTGQVPTEHAAVTAILNYIADNIKYTYNPPQFDAVYTLRTKSGNCQNFAHLSMALLRAAGIPARIVGGISLKQSWKIPVDENNFLVQSMGQGGHAWMEIYFPDLGWLSYDPQQSKQFTSSRHIKQTHGLDSRDINDSWRAAPYLPEYDELIDAKFLADAVALKPKYSDKLPKSYLLSNNVLAKAEIPPPVPPPKPPVVKPPAEEKPKPPVVIKPKPPVVPPPPEEKPEPPIVKPPAVKPPEEKPRPPVPVVTPPPVAKPKPPVVAMKPPVEERPKPPGPMPKPPEPVKAKPEPPPSRVVEFGNIEFPNLVDIFRVVGNQGVKILDKETVEYVTSRYIYAQAFEVKEPISVNTISLAMRKFGGDGSIYIDLVADNDGRPGFTGMRSVPIFLDRVPKKPGYYWVDFVFPSDNGAVRLKEGRYWIVLRHSGEVIMNWFYIPGNACGESDDTRSTMKGYKWQDIQNYDFVFKVRGYR